MEIAALKKEARSKKTSVQRLEQLVRDKDSGIQLAVANNPNAPAAALEYLAHDPDHEVRWQVAYNRSCSKALLECLMTDDDLQVKETAAITLHELYSKKGETL